MRAAQSLFAKTQVKIDSPDWATRVDSFELLAHGFAKRLNPTN